MVKEKFKTKLLVSVVLGLFFTAAPAIAFFVGNLEVKSKFGGKFEASFEIHLDNDGNYEVALGKVDDYNKLGLYRPSLVNSLKLEKPAATTGAKRVIRIFSNIPLFFPSFNLVLIARHNGGTLLENFLITVNFQKGLVLNALGAKKKEISFPYVKPLIAIKEIPAEEKKVLSQLADKNLALREREGLPQKIGTKRTPETKSPAIKPTPIKNSLESHRRLSGAIWAVPKMILPVSKMISAESSFPNLGAGIEKKERPSIIESKPIRLNRGEGLFSVARKIKIKEIDPSRIEVALWLKNIGSFIYGNINGFEAGTQLEVDGIEKLAEKIDLETAKNILSSQAKEWKIARKKEANQKEIKLGIKEVPLPLESIDQAATIFDWVEEWKSSWEDNDIGKHISFYCPDFIGKENQNSGKVSSAGERKKQLLLKFPDPRLNLSTQNLISKPEGFWVVFEQHFFSKAMESKGTKEVKIKWEDGAWKIDKEEFYADKHEIAKLIRRGKDKIENSRPFVIHVSSHSREAEAISVSNKLRKNGYDAYFAPVRISKDINIYRVYIGRFTTWEQGHRIVKVLGENRLAEYAVVIPYPLTLQVGKVGSIFEARKLLQRLRQKGISGLLSISNGPSSKGMQLGVYVGAFKKPENAIWLTKKLKNAGFSSKQIRP